MATTTEQERMNRLALKAREDATWALVDAMCETYRNITGQMPTDRMRDAIYYAVL